MAVTDLIEFLDKEQKRAEAAKDSAARNGSYEGGVIASGRIQFIKECRTVLSMKGPEEEFWTPTRVSHVLADCATYFRTLYTKHKIGSKDRGIDPDKLDAASKAMFRKEVV